MTSKLKKYSKLFEDIGLKEQYLECIRQKINYIEIDFRIIEQYDFLLSEDILDNFDEHLSLMTEALNLLVATEYLDETEAIKINIRLTNLPKITNKMIWELRTADLNKLVSIRGYVRKISEILHCEIKSTFECRDCGNKFTINQFYDELITPSVCKACGNKNITKTNKGLLFSIKQVPFLQFVFSGVIFRLILSFFFIFAT
jgi:DNA replicative helicase MCM subunit Mcm2 (Cdc46/Mcm family)